MSTNVNVFTKINATLCLEFKQLKQMVNNSQNWKKSDNFPNDNCTLNSYGM